MYSTDIMDITNTKIRGGEGSRRRRLAEGQMTRFSQLRYQQNTTTVRGGEEGWRWRLAKGHTPRFLALVKGFGFGFSLVYTNYSMCVYSTNITTTTTVQEGGGRRR